MVPSAAQTIHPGRAVKARLNTSSQWLAPAATVAKFASIQLSEVRIETMEIDWLATLAEQGDIAKSKATEVAALVVKPELPLEIASRLYRDVDKGAQTFDRILSDMEDADVSDELLEAADALAELWGQLSVASANKLRELQGWPPTDHDERGPALAWRVLLETRAPI